MNYYLIRKRYGNETYDLREFIQKDSYTVASIAQIMDKSSKYRFIQSSWNWVHTNIQYPENNLNPDIEDYHYSENYLTSPTLINTIKNFIQTGAISGFQPAKIYTTYDFWNFPAETIRDSMGDCEDTSILLCSILRNMLSENEVFVTVGLFSDYGHSWVTVFNSNGQPLVLETTGSNIVKIDESIIESPPYKPVFRFNDKNVIELYTDTNSVFQNTEKNWRIAKLTEMQKYYGLKNRIQ